MATMRLDMLTGAAAGLLGTLVMDRVTTRLYEREPPEVGRGEGKARGGKTAYTIAAERMARLVNVATNDRQLERAGQIIHLGLGMLEIAAQHQFHFDTCQMPLNVMDAHFRSFGQQVVPKLVASGIGVLGMKPMGDGLILKSQTVTPIACLHYALSPPRPS